MPATCTNSKAGSSPDRSLIYSQTEPSGLDKPSGTCEQRPKAEDVHGSRRKDSSHGGALDSGLLSYTKWCARLTPMVLSTRSAFAAFLSRTIKLSRLGREAKTIPTFFPIPLPYMGIYGRMPVASPAFANHSRHVSRAVHVMVAALNF